MPEIGDSAQVAGLIKRINSVEKKLGEVVDVMTEMCERQKDTEAQVAVFLNNRSNEQFVTKAVDGLKGQVYIKIKALESELEAIKNAGLIKTSVRVDEVREAVFNYLKQFPGMKFTPTMVQINMDYNGEELAKSTVSNKLVQLFNRGFIKYEKTNDRNGHYWYEDELNDFQKEPE